MQMKKEKEKHIVIWCWRIKIHSGSFCPQSADRETRITYPLQKKKKKNLNGSDLSLSLLNGLNLSDLMQKTVVDLNPCWEGGGAEALEDNSPSFVKIIELNICKVQ